MCFIKSYSTDISCHRISKNIQLLQRLTLFPFFLLEICLSNLFCAARSSCLSPVDWQIFFLHSPAACCQAKPAQHQKLHQHHLIVQLPLLPRQHLALKLGNCCPRWALVDCSGRVFEGWERAGATILPGQLLPMGAGESWALQGTPGERKIAIGQNIELNIVGNPLDENSMIGLRKLDTGLVADTKQKHRLKLKFGEMWYLERVSGVLMLFE